ncbi:hypothetical protein CYMTET_52780 [Cymbomonas tetramitiformis]|uniref:Integrase catalytic domain-containing protein n=1 Tax=Cymbomonas tetramitiformis TaxID=36881 RepID=A0AAE0ER04_9CHLO|nr:hypothetical protein CYMTET_52780 [Cymbomonas tetramitiformis]
MENMAQALRASNEAMKLNAERRESGKSKDHEGTRSGLTSLDNAPKTVQCVVKLLGTVKYTGSERNRYESWVQFKTQLESAVHFNPDLLELKREGQVSDIADIKGLSSFKKKSVKEETSTAEGPSSQAEEGDNDGNDGEDRESVDGLSFIAVPGSGSVASEVLSAILKQVTVGDAFDVVRRCGNDGLKAYRKLRCRVESQLFGHLACSMKKLCKLTVNATEDPVKQLGYYVDVMSSIVSYGGARLDSTTVEVLVTALAVAPMPVEYAQVVADLSKERRPSLDILVQRTAHFYVNVVQQSLVPLSGIVGGTVDEETVAVARALVADRSRQNEEKKFNDGRKLVCPTCSGMHSAEKCWIVNLAGKQEFIKLNPIKEKAVRENYARRLKKIVAKKTPEAAVAATVLGAIAKSTTRQRRTEVSAEELWDIEDHEEVPVACATVVTVSNQKVVYTGEVLADSWVYGVFDRGEKDKELVQEEYALRTPAGETCAAMVEKDEDRTLYVDSMATKSIFNDLSVFEGSQVHALEASSFEVMAGEVTTSRGGGCGTITLWNRVTKKVDVLRVEAQYVPESPFNLISAVSLEDKYALYAQLGDGTLKDKEGWSEYGVIRRGKVYVLPEVKVVEAALPVVVDEKEEYGPMWDSKWNEERGPFQVDLCADEHNCQVPEHYSLSNSVFSHCLTGKSFYGNPPYEDSFIEKLLAKVLMDFSKVPTGTRFLLVVPYKPNAWWWRLATKFEELHIYSKGSVIFSVRTDQCYNVLELVESEPGRVFSGNSLAFSGVVFGSVCGAHSGREGHCTHQKLEYTDALEHYRKIVKATGRVFLEETRMEQVVYDLDVLVLHSDNDTTIVARRAKKYCEEHAIVQRTTSPYLHENNARAETINKLLQTKARAMLATAGLPATMWPLAMRYAVFLLNRLAKARLGIQASMQMLNQKYDLSVLRMFRCRAFAYIDATLRTKLADRATPLIYVGQEEKSTAYLLHSPEKQKVVRSGMVRFDERVDQYGKLVMSWDPAMLRPFKSLYDCTSLDGKFVSAFTGGATIILDLRVYVEPRGDEFTGVVKLSSAGGGWFWTPVSVFLEAKVEHLALLFEYCGKLTVNSFYPVFEKVEVQWSEGDDWEMTGPRHGENTRCRISWWYNYHEHLGFPGPAKGKVVTRAAKVMSSIQIELALQQTWLPARYIRTVHRAALQPRPSSAQELQLSWAYVYVVIIFVTFGCADTNMTMLRDNVSSAEDELMVVGGSTLLAEETPRDSMERIAAAYGAAGTLGAAA